jgi:hypothetical protein
MVIRTKNAPKKKKITLLGFLKLLNLWQIDWNYNNFKCQGADDAIESGDLKSASFSHYMKLPGVASLAKEVAKLDDVSFEIRFEILDKESEEVVGLFRVTQDDFGARGGWPR